MKENALNGSKVYLSGPIQYDDGPNWRVPVIESLSKFGIEVFDPFSDEKQMQTGVLKECIEKEDYDEVEKICTKFVKKDLAVIDRCDFLIAYNPNGIRTTGTPCEVHHAVQLKKPVLIVCPEGKASASLWYFGYIRHQYIYGSWEECYSYLDEVDRYKHKDNHRWWFVYKLV
jgi:nucleoside 2-deoxyribosyltransferase